MSEQLYDFFGEMFQRYFKPTIGTYPAVGKARIHSLFALTDDVSDRLEQARRAAMAWSEAETRRPRLASEMFVITQHGLLYAAALRDAHRELYYLATPRTMFDPFVDEVEISRPHQNTVMAVDSRLGRDLAAAHPMDAALRRILDEHVALRVDLPA